MQQRGHTGQSQRGDGFKPFQTPFLTDVSTPQAVTELIRSEKIDDFLTLTNFPDVNEATAFAVCLHKCDRYHLDVHKKLFWYAARAKVSVNEMRAKMYLQAVTGVVSPAIMQKGKGDGKSEASKD